MFKTILRKIQSNPLEKLLKKAKAKNQKKFLVAWNRGLGDIPLGLYALQERIRQYIPEAKVTFLIRDALKEGFLLLDGINMILAPDWKRNQPFDLAQTLDSLNVSAKKFDVVIEKPDPTHWVSWQLGKVIPRLTWNSNYDQLFNKFGLEEGYQYIGVQMKTDSGHSLWRDWPKQRWEELFKALEVHPKIKVLLFGLYSEELLSFSNVIDLRGKTTVIEVLSIIKNRCSYLVLPDGGILSLIYYLDVDFPIKIVSLWNDCQGVLKQKVASPNPQLKHIPLITNHNESLFNIHADQVLMHLFEEKK